MATPEKGYRSNQRLAHEKTGRIQWNAEAAEPLGEESNAELLSRPCDDKPGAVLPKAIMRTAMGN